MKRILIMLVAGLLGLAAADRPASASTFELGTLDPGTTTGFVANFGSGISSFNDTIKFELVGVQNELVGSIADISSVNGEPTDSVNFTLDLFAASDPTTSLGTFTDVTGVGLAFSYLSLAAGEYFFRVMGETGDNGNAYSYRFTVSEVPIPPALLLFATALGGMAVVGKLRRRGTQGGTQA